MRRETANALLASGDMINHGVPSKVWLGVPVQSGERIVGIMATQDYEDSQNLTAWPEACFKAVAPTVAGLIDRAVSWQEKHGELSKESEIRQQKQALFATAGHDVRSPLAVIQRYSDLLRETLKDSPSALTAARDHAPAAVELGGWMRSLESWAENQGIGATCEMTAPGGEDARVDADWLGQVLQPIVRARITAQDVARVRLRLKVQPIVTIPAGLLRLSFCFEALPAPGTPTPPEGRDRRLQPVRLDDGRTYDGVTVSLAIAKRLAEIIGADLKVSETRQAPWRANLIMTVPAEIAFDAAADEDGGGAWSIMRKQLQQDASKIVVVDANPGPRRELVQVLSEATGAAPVAVGAVKDLTIRLRHGQVSAIMASVETGPMAVREIALAMRGARESSILPYLVVVSADQSPEGVERLLDNGADAYVPRPFSRAALWWRCLIPSSSTSGDPR